VSYDSLSGREHLACKGATRVAGFMSAPSLKVLAALRALGCRIRVLSAGRYMCQCPAHPDTNPSLSMLETTDGRLLLKCHAGCDTRDILSELGLRFSDLFPRRMRP